MAAVEALAALTMQVIMLAAAVEEGLAVQDLQPEHRQMAVFLEAQVPLELLVIFILTLLAVEALAMVVQYRAMLNGAERQAGLLTSVGLGRLAAEAQYTAAEVVAAAAG
jgi:hypothetical protein